MDGVILTPLQRIHHPKGSIYHAIKKCDNGFLGFGEAYFSTINKGEIKGWKKHTQMTLNLVVPFGRIEFIVYSEKTQKFFNVTLSQDNYQRLTVKPKLWMAFRGMGENNILLNVANIEHNPDEAVNVGLEEIAYPW